jgi:Protein of unknown function (DUF2384)
MHEPGHSQRVEQAFAPAFKPVREVRRFVRGRCGSGRKLAHIPKEALNRQTPLLYARTELRAREVEALIGRLDQGIFS